MNIAVFGLGYVGCVTAACLAQHGHQVIGVDISPDKVEAINRGQSPIQERGIDELIAGGVARGWLRATMSAAEAVAHANLCLVCVGTPSTPHGGLDLTFVERVCSEIGAALSTAHEYKVIAVRSTILPGMLSEQLIPALERRSGKRAGVNFGVAVNPEFLREGSAIGDFEHPSFTLVGELDARSGHALATVYAKLPAPILRTTPDAACMVKYACNAFHALKVTFANEIGRLCQPMNVDSGEVMGIFCQDNRLNISTRYLQPGFAFGGSCLPKDLRALVHFARHRDIDLPVLEAILPSNQRQIQLALEAVQGAGRLRVALAGLSFKPGTDDLRESPAVLLAETLIGKGYCVRIYDPAVRLARLVGGNRAFIEQAIPHFAALFCDTPEELVEDAEVIVAVHGLTPELAALIRPHQTVIDLTGALAPQQEEAAAV